MILFEVESVKKLLPPAGSVHKNFRDLQRYAILKLTVFGSQIKVVRCFLCALLCQQRCSSGDDPRSGRGVGTAYITGQDFAVDGGALAFGY